MNCPSPVHGRRRRTTIIALAVLVLFAFYLTSTHDFEGLAIRRQKMPSPEPHGDAKPPSKPEVKTDGEKPAEEKEEEPPEPAMPPNPKTAERPMSYGTAQRPMFKGPGNVISMDTLPAEFIPSSVNKRRLIVVGDVHGMLEPLQELLQKVEYDSEAGNDHLVFVGDMINKGPDSAGVIDLAMTLGASAVRGNHEDRVLLVQEGMQKPFVADKPDDQDGEAGTDTLEQQHFAHGDYEDRSTARGLKKEHIEWIAKLPVILRAGPVEGFHDLVIVHAGLVPGLSLEHQSPWAAMNMRSLVYPREQLRREDAKKMVEKFSKTKADQPNGHPVTKKQKAAMIEKEVERTTRPSDKNVIVPVNGREGDPWSEVWNKHQEKLGDSDNKMTVMYGHDAKQGLNVGKHTFGLDSGCVYGGELTALVISGSPEGVRHEIVQVKCTAAKTADDDEL